MPRLKLSIADTVQSSRAVDTPVRRAACVRREGLGDADVGQGRAREIGGGTRGHKLGSRYVRHMTDPNVVHMTDPTSLPSFPPPPSEHPQRGRVLDALIDEGFGPNIDGDVAFTVQDQQLFVRCLEGDMTIMRVFGQWQIGADVPQTP